MNGTAPALPAGGETDSMCGMPGGFPHAPLWGCRGCIDHEAPDVRKENYLRIVEMVFGARPRPVHRPAILVEDRQARKKAKEAAKLAAKRMESRRIRQSPLSGTQGLPGGTGANLWRPDHASDPALQKRQVALGAID